MYGEARIVSANASLRAMRYPCRTGNSSSSVRMSHSISRPTVVPRRIRRKARKRDSQHPPTSDTRSQFGVIYSVFDANDGGWRELPCDRRATLALQQHDPCFPWPMLRLQQDAHW